MLRSSPAACPPTAPRQYGKGPKPVHLLAMKCPTTRIHKGTSFQFYSTVAVRKEASNTTWKTLGFAALLAGCGARRPPQRRVPLVPFTQDGCTSSILLFHDENQEMRAALARPLFAASWSAGLAVMGGGRLCLAHTDLGRSVAVSLDGQRHGGIQGWRRH